MPDKTLARSSDDSALAEQARNRLMVELARARDLANANRALMDLIEPMFGSEVFETDAAARHIRLVVACMDADIGLIQTELLAVDTDSRESIVREARENNRASREAAYASIYGGPVPSGFVWPLPAPYDDNALR